MKEYSLQELARAVNGQIIYDGKTKYYDSVAIDSRDVKDGGIFFALKGENTNGHNYVRNACENNAGAVIVEHEFEGISAAQIIVDDTFQALKMLAKHYINKFKIPFVAITGSSGKTTTKDIVAGVLSARYCVHKTKGNLNSTTGVPLTIFDLEDKHQIAVIEMSMSHPKEILGNADIVRPDTALITNIGNSHIQFLKSKENIFKAKCEILEYLNENNCAILNGDDEYLNRVCSDKYNIVRVGIDSGDLRAYDIIQSDNGISFSCVINGKRERFEFVLMGAHNVLNCLMAIAVGLRYNLSAEEIRIGLKLCRFSANRMETVRLKGITLINDTYNANPDAVKAAINALCAAGEGKRKIAVFGDMLELGEYSALMHEECGEYAAGQKVDLLLTFGEFGNNYLRGYEKVNPKGKCIVFDDAKAVCEYLKQIVNSGDVVLFKASRSVKLEEVFLSLKGSIADE